MTKEKTEEIKMYTKILFTDVMHELTDGVDYIIKDLKNYANDCVSVMFYFDPEYKKFYFYYELDERAKWSKVHDEIIYRVNAKLNANFFKDTNCRVEVLGTNASIRPDSMPIMADQTNQLTTETFTYVKCFGNVYRFIEDSQRLLTRNNIFFEPCVNIDEKNIEKREFAKKIAKINSKYDFYKDNSTAIPAAFEEYKIIVKDFYGIDLYPADEDNVARFYLDARYKEK